MIKSKIYNGRLHLAYVSSSYIIYNHYHILSQIYFWRKISAKPLKIIFDKVDGFLATMVELSI